MRRNRRFSLRLLALPAGILLILSGAGILGAGVLSGWIAHGQAAVRQENDRSAVSAWDRGGSQALAGAPTGTATPAASAPPGWTGTCGGGGGAYALVEFTGLPQYGYADVSANGDWTQLDYHSMDHWAGSPPPGGQGNVIIAFHREPDFQHIDQLAPGDTVTIQDTQCNTYVYTVTQRWTLDPNAVTQLGSTSGHELTLVTCTPWWQDSQRIVWRAELTSVNGSAV
jgi:LPXTG-site transpeptidase (sortase) family protein